ncbi:AhpC/TSA family protein [Opitutia bacterium ISCC 51]|nr:AhpC/TSA family protein [Opitutae bacterium ISCC 51]QXD27369.1 AhpC/TSA family protein [Opitutae bacterium ISCC 52]
MLAWSTSQAQENNSEEGSPSGERAERPPRAERAQSENRPPRGGGPRGGPRRAPPPRSTDGSREAGTPKYTVAPDGVGVTMRDGASPNPYTKDTVTYVPWEDGSKMNPLKVGSKLPSGSVVWTKEGEKLDLNKVAMEAPTLLIYYRGGWCPYCNIQLHELKESVPELEKMGYQLLAISTDTVEALNAYDDSEINYQLLADPDLKLATNLGIKYKVVKQYLEHVKSMPDGRAFSLEKRNGGFLVTPSAFVLDTTGTVRFAYVNDNYTVRASQDSLLKAAKKALE